MATSNQILGYQCPKCGQIYNKAGVCKNVMMIGKNKVLETHPLSVMLRPIMPQLPEITEQTIDNKAQA